jgi:hypothetical protein
MTGIATTTNEHGVFQCVDCKSRNLKTVMHQFISCDESMGLVMICQDCKTQMCDDPEHVRLFQEEEGVRFKNIKLVSRTYPVKTSL